MWVQESCWQAIIITVKEGREEKEKEKEEECVVLRNGK